LHEVFISAHIIAGTGRFYPWQSGNSKFLRIIGLEIMKILTWNINGIRAVKKDQPLKKLFDSLDADIICLQETKITSIMSILYVAMLGSIMAFIGEK
jgi:hypothetical protein